MQIQFPLQGQRLGIFRDDRPALSSNDVTFTATTDLSLLTPTSALHGQKNIRINITLGIKRYD
jgi:hypothetical protein